MTDAHRETLEARLRWASEHAEALEKNWERLVEIARAERDEAQAQAAAMREALEHCRHRPHEHNPGPDFTITRCEVIDRALAPDAGRALLERLRRAEELADGDLVHPRLAQLRERAERAEAERDEAREMLRALGGATANE